MKNLQSKTVLSNGVEMPWFGLGVFKVEEGPELVEAIKSAIKAGYRSIDTAAIYGNEAAVGEGFVPVLKQLVFQEKNYLLLQKYGTQIKDMKKRLLHTKSLKIKARLFRFISCSLACRREI